MKTIHSVIRKVIEQINQTQDIKVIQTIFINNLQQSRINQQDKDRMIKTIQTYTTYQRVIKYIYDCLLKYEGVGVIK